MVSYHDPYIPHVKTNEGREFTSVDISADLSHGAFTGGRSPLAKDSAKGEALAKADCVVLTTNHRDFDIAFIQKHAKLTVDMRNMVVEKMENVYKL